MGQTKKRTWSKTIIRSCLSHVAHVVHVIYVVYIVNKVASLHCIYTAVVYTCKAFNNVYVMTCCNSLLTVLYYTPTLVLLHKLFNM